MGSGSRWWLTLAGIDDLAGQPVVLGVLEVETETDRFHNCLGPVGDGQLFIDARKVVLHGLLRDV